MKTTQNIVPGCCRLFARAFLLTLTAIIGIEGHAAEPAELYFAAKSGTSEPLEDKPVVVTVKPDAVPAFSTNSSGVDLELVLRLPSLEAQRDYTPLVIDDYRYDEPNYFQDKRVPNVVIEVTKADGTPVAFRASSQGGGMSLTLLSVNVGLQIGGDPGRIEKDIENLGKEAKEKKMPFQDFRKEIEKLQLLHKTLMPHVPGTYRIRAHYRPKVEGKWIGELSTQPVTVTIKDK